MCSAIKTIVKYGDTTAYLKLRAADYILAAIYKN
jgi:hypothetical protein